VIEEPKKTVVIDKPATGPALSASLLMDMDGAGDTMRSSSIMAKKGQTTASSNSEPDGCCKIF